MRKNSFFKLLFAKLFFLLCFLLSLPDKVFALDYLGPGCCYPMTVVVSKGEQISCNNCETEILCSKKYWLSYDYETGQGIRCYPSNSDYYRCVTNYVKEGTICAETCHDFWLFCAPSAPGDYYWHLTKLFGPYYSPVPLSPDACIVDTTSDDPPAVMVWEGLYYLLQDVFKKTQINEQWCSKAIYGMYRYEPYYGSCGHGCSLGYRLTPNCACISILYIC
jgi:hypothetical protein